jgi:hypothetical protein
MIGSNDKQYVGFRRFMHYIFQYPFRKIAKKFLNFDAVNKTAKDILTEVGKGYSMDVLRQVISLAYLNDKKVVREGGTSCVIGDGYATMSSLLLKNKRQRVVLVNLSKTLWIDLWHLKLLLKGKFSTDVTLVTSEDSILRFLSETKDKPSVIAIEAKNHQLLQFCPLDLIINIASMQEMNPEVIEEYFIDMSSAAKHNSSVFYCCNRGYKTLPDGTMLSFKDYPWHFSSQILEDEICPWYKKYYNTKLPFLSQLRCYSTQIGKVFINNELSLLYCIFFGGINALYK